MTNAQSTNCLAEQIDMVPAQFLPNVKSWTFAAPTSNAENGVKSFPLGCGGMDIRCLIHGCTAPFEPSSMEPSARMTLVLKLPENWDSHMGLMEEALIKEVTARSVTLFGAERSEDSLRQAYKAVTKKTAEYPRNLRVKINTAGFHATRYWDTKRDKIEAPTEFAGATFSAMIHVRGLWIGADAWGLVCDATDLQVLSASPECPF